MRSARTGTQLAGHVLKDILVLLLLFLVSLSTMVVFLCLWLVFMSWWGQNVPTRIGMCDRFGNFWLYPCGELFFNKTCSFYLKKQTKKTVREPKQGFAVLLSQSLLMQHIQLCLLCGLCPLCAQAQNFIFTLWDRTRPGRGSYTCNHTHYPFCFPLRHNWPLG